MFKWMARALILSCLVLVTGCPYVAQVPVGEPDAAALDSRLLGLWAGTDSKDDSFQVEILPFNQSEYYVEMFDQGDTERFRLFAFKIDNDTFLQINELTADKTKAEYSFARYEFLSDNELEVRFVGEEIVPEELGTDAKGLIEFLQKHLNDPSLDDRDSQISLIRQE